MFRTAGIGAGLLSPLVVASEFASLAPALSCSDHSSTATSLVWMLSRQSCLIAATRSFTGTTSLIFLGCRIRFLRSQVIALPQSSRRSVAQLRMLCVKLGKLDREIEKRNCRAAKVVSCPPRILTPNLRWIE